jgi:integrase
VAEGIEKRHLKDCAAKRGGRCRCRGAYEAWVYSPRDGKKIRKTLPREAEAKSWRADAKRAIDHGTLRAPSAITWKEASDAFLVGAEAGTIRDRSGEEYKPSTLRGYRRDLERELLPIIGSSKLNAVTTSDFQEMVDGWEAEGVSPSTVRNRIKPVQAISRRARARGGLAVNATHDLELPAERPSEVEIVGRNVAAKLIGAVPVADRALWATALYAGLRFGELRALRWGKVDLANGTIRIDESWDPKEGPIPPKTRKSRRTTPMPGGLRDLLIDERLRRGEPPADALVFAGKGGKPFHATSLYRRADRAWKEAGLSDRLRLHQARHTYASFMIAAGVNAKALSTFMGHSSIKVTFDLYGHLMPGAEAEAAALLDTFLGAEMESGEESVRAVGAVHGDGGTGARTGAHERQTA